MIRPVSILFVGDIVGGIGRRTLLSLLPGLRERFSPDFVVVNGENIAGGLGITPKNAQELFANAVDVITLGNHTYRHREVYHYLDAEPRILRPANFLRSLPAFSVIENALGALEKETDHILVDVHAEATSEKVGMGWHLDGRVTAVVGTHTHVPTADARVLPGGTAYITDVGMTGPRGGVIGVKRELALDAMMTKMPVKFETSTEDPWLNGVLIRAGEPRRATAIEQVLEPAPGVQ